MKLSAHAKLQIALALALLGTACSRARFEPVVDAAQPDMAPVVDGRGPSDGSGEVASARDAVEVCPAPTVSGCASVGTGICDPVCQSGDCDWCAQKCSYAYSSSGRQTVVCAGKGAGRFLQSCALYAAGSPQQSDDCAPGNICLAPTIGDAPTFCFALCRTSADCPYGVACAGRKLSAAGGTVTVCDPPYDQCGPDGTCCNPLDATSCGADRFCFLVSPDLGTGHSRTVCELSYGDGRDGAPCSTARDCQLRNVCVDGACRQACASGAPCPAGEACTTFGSEFGYCS